jgi:tRNA (guanine37-N1)-methyltransferase
MRIDVVTLFPEEFRGLTGLGVTGRGIEHGRLDLHVWNPRDYTENRHRNVDDRPYGGGPGMVMAVQPLKAAIAAAISDAAEPVKVSLLSPQGQRLNQSDFRGLAKRERLLLICGRYEGIDQRLVDEVVEEEWSIGDYVLSGGELAAAVIIDAIARLIPGVLGDEQSAEQDSFSDGLLDCPHYTRPEVLDGNAVPEVLLSGNHAEIARWRRMQSLGQTWERRPDLLDKQNLSKEDNKLLELYQQQKQK